MGKRTTLTVPMESILKAKKINLLTLFSILDGIDSKDKGGWWDTEEGVLFGSNVLVQIIKRSEYE